MPKNQPNGILLLYKREGITSRQCLEEALQILPGKAGLEGILDPFASGVLIAAYGKATRFLSYFHTLPKRYLAHITFGYATSTDDLTGEVIAEGPTSHITLELLQTCLQKFQGTHLQIPPTYSNVKIAGNRAHVLARAGSSVSLPPRTITVYETKIRPIEPPLTWQLECTVSAGTYLRALGRDIARAAGTVGYLSALKRLAIGKITEQYCKAPAAITQEDLIPAEEAFFWLPKVFLTYTQFLAISQGRTIPFDSPNGLVRLYHEKKFIGLGWSFGNTLKAERLIVVLGERHGKKKRN